MNEDSWITIGNHKDYTDPDTLISFLKENQIEYKINQYKSTNDPYVTGGQPFQSSMEILIPEASLPQYHRIWEDETRKALKEGNLDHYFLEFNEEELLEVVETNEDGWPWEDVTLAKILLAQKGVQVDEWVLEERRLDKEAESAKPEVISPWAFPVGFGIIFIAWAIPIFSPLGGAVNYLLFVSFAIGSMIPISRKQTDMGKSVWLYDAPTRKIGTLLVVLSLISAILIHILLNKQIFESR